MSKSTEIHQKGKVDVDDSFDSDTECHILQFDIKNVGERLYENPEIELENISNWTKSVLSYAENKICKIETQKGPITKKSEELETLMNEIVKLTDDTIKQEFDRKVEENRNKILLEVLNKLQQDIQYIKTELDELAGEFPQLEMDRDAKIEQFKDTFNANKYAAKYYTKYLGLYVDIEDTEEFVVKIYFFSKNGPNKECYITLQKKDGQWLLLNASPQIPNDKLCELQMKLKEDRDIAFVVCSARKMFLNHKNRN